MTWQPITKDARDGRRVWLAVVRYVDGLSSQTDEWIKDSCVSVVMARYDTWKSVWRFAETGVDIIGPGYCVPHLYQPCEIPAAPKYAEARKPPEKSQ
jgi:hypothetical protein